MRTIVYASIGALLFAACTRHETQQPANDPPPARVNGDAIAFAANAPQLAYLAVQPAQPRAEIATALNGRLAWDDDVTSRVFSPLSGRVVEILADPGRRVAAGDVLARVRSADFGAAQSDARRSAADLKAAERALTRTRDLLAHGAASQKDLEGAETDYARALSERDRAAATLSLYGGKGDLVNGLFALKAPLGGVVVDRFVNPGQEVRADQVGDKPLFVVSDPKRLWLFLDVNDADLLALHRDQDVVIRSRAFRDRVFHGRVEIIGAGLDPATRTARVRCRVDNSDGLLRAEMYVTADVHAGPAHDLEVPSKAVFLKDNANYVFVEIAPRAFQRRSVTVGPQSDGHVVVLGGVSAGQRVVTNGVLLLQSMLEGGASS